MKWAAVDAPGEISLPRNPCFKSRIETRAAPPQIVLICILGDGDVAVEFVNIIHERDCFTPQNLLASRATNAETTKRTGT